MEARRRGLLTVGILGYDGGRIVSEQLADHAIVVRSDYIRASRTCRRRPTTCLAVSWRCWTRAPERRRCVAARSCDRAHVNRRAHQSFQRATSTISAPSSSSSTDGVPA
jgi:hypothetical protein